MKRTTLVIALWAVFVATVSAQKAGSEPQLAKEANEHFVSGDFLKAYPLYSQLVSLYPQNVDYSYRFGACAIYSDPDKSKAIKFLTSATKRNVADPMAWYYLGKALLGMVYEKEEEEIQILFDKYAVAGFPIGHREEVEAYLNTHNPEKRIPLLLQKAQKLEQEGDLPQALAALHEAATLSSDKAVEEQVRLYEASGKWEQAIATGLPLIDTKRASEELQLKFATLVFYNLAQPKHLESAMQIIEENDLVDILGWMKKYQRFLKQNTITLKTSQ